MKIGASFSVGRVAYSHDMRISNTSNVDLSLSQDNITLVDVLRGRSIEEYTNEKMQPVIDAYNEKQKRSDRKINTDYCTYFNSQKNHGQLVYEAVLQFGEHETLGGEYYSPTTPIRRKEELKRQFLKVYHQTLSDMRRDFPHMEIVYAVIHFDEPLGTPHMHVAFQPIGENYKQGLSKQVSVGNALSCDGIERLKSRAEAQELGGYQLSRFYKTIRHKYLNRILTEDYGYEIKEEQHGIKHDEPDIFKAVKRLEKQKTELEAEIYALESKISNLSKIELLELYNQLQDFEKSLKVREGKMKEYVHRAINKALNTVSEEDKEKYASFRELVLQSNPELVRAFDGGLRAKLKEGQEIADEVVEEYAKLIGFTM